MFLCAEPLLIRLLRVLQVPTTSGDSGFLSCADTPSVLPPPVHFFFLSLSFFNFIYHFVSFCHLHSVDQKPRDNLMSWHFFLCVFNSLQTFALNSTSASAGAGVPVVLILFFFFSWPIIVRVRLQVFISISKLTWHRDEPNHQPLQRPQRCVPIPPENASSRADVRPVTRAGLRHKLCGFPHDSERDVAPPPSTWLLQCLRYQHWQLLCAALVLLSSLLHSQGDHLFLSPYSVKAAYEAFIKMLVTIFYCRAGGAKLCRDPSGGTSWPSVTRTTDYILCVTPCMCLLKVYRCVHAFQLGSKVYFPPKLDRCVLRTNAAKLHQ